MLEYLHISNLALIEDMELEFGPGMNVLTGETGAGKSFILKALGFLLGDRLKADMVRPGADRAHVEALFSLKEPLRLSGDGDADATSPAGEKGRADRSDRSDDAADDGLQLVLRRDLLASGRSRLTVNGSLRPQSYARELREQLISYTSQHGQQKLLQPAYQDALMEQTMGRQDLLGERARMLQGLEEVRAKRLAIEAKRAKLIEMRDLLEMQQQEIDKVNPKPGEDEELEEIRMKVRRQEEANQDYDTALTMLYGSGRDMGLLDAVGEFYRHLENMARYDEQLQSSVEAVSALNQELQQLGASLRHPPQLEDMPDDIENVERRLYELSTLKRKLRRTLPQILNLKAEIEEKISFLDVCELDIRTLQREEAAKVAELRELVERIKPLRHASCATFARALEGELKGLGFSDQVRVLPDFCPKKLWEGVEDESVRILWAPNPGQPAQPLDRIASGGELSRFLLALAGVLPSAVNATFIFDEVDSGVGGVTLNHLAQRLEDLAARHQMLLITHWPQIAARADRHFQIVKVVREARTYTLCTPLQGEKLHAELVRMGGGGDQGEALARALEGRQAARRAAGQN